MAQLPALSSGARILPSEIIATLAIMTVFPESHKAPQKSTPSPFLSFGQDYLPIAVTVEHSCLEIHGATLV